MTREEFAKQGWTGGMTARYEGDIYDVANCDFEDFTVGLVNKGDTAGNILVLPCEEVEIQEELTCDICGNLFAIDDTGVSTHSADNGGELDGDHVPYSLDREKSLSSDAEKGN